jgi:hypothetical protein
VATACVTAWAVIVTASGSSWIDFRSYVAAATRVLANQSMYHPLQLAGPYELARSAGDVFVYPPSAMLLIAPFGAVPGGLVAWLLSGIGVFFSGLLAVIRRERGAVTPILAGAVLFVVALTTPFVEAIAWPGAGLTVLDDAEKT